MNSPRRIIQPFSGRWTSDRPAWKILIALNIGVAMLQTVLDLLIAPGLLDEWLALIGDDLRHGHLWQLVTYMFLHGAPGDVTLRAVHLGANMLGLFFFGREVESIVGKRHFLGIFFGGGVLGGLTQVLFFPAASLVGASAGVFAIMLAFTTILPEIEMMLFLFMVIPVRIRAKYLALFLVGTSLLFLFSGTYAEMGHLAHLGGAFLGWVYVRQLGYGRPLHLPTWHRKRNPHDARMDRLTPEQFISEEIDPILDKIAREGIHSLTTAERKILEKGREKIARKTSGR